MTDEKLDLLLRDALRPDEMPPEIDLTAKRKPVRSKVPGVLAACACLVVCAAAFFAIQPSFSYRTAATESSVMGKQVMDSAVSYDGAIKESVVETSEAAEAAPEFSEQTTAVSATGKDLCAYPKEPGGVEAAADQWMRLNAPGKAYELLADTERYCSYRVEPAEGEVLYLVIDKETGEPASPEKLLERGKFAVDAQQVNMLYVNQDQELILVQGDGEINLGPIE